MLLVIAGLGLCLSLTPLDNNLPSRFIDPPQVAEYLGECSAPSPQGLNYLTARDSYTADNSQLYRPL